MLIERVDCRNGSCRAYGEGVLQATVDYVFAYGPAVVRWNVAGDMSMVFDPPVQCEHRHDYELGLSYLYCSQVLIPTRLRLEDGEVFLVEGD